MNCLYCKDLCHKNKVGSYECEKCISDYFELIEFVCTNGSIERISFYSSKDYVLDFETKDRIYRFLDTANFTTITEFITNDKLSDIKIVNKLFKKFFKLKAFV